MYLAPVRGRRRLFHAFIPLAFLSGMVSAASGEEARHDHAPAERLAVDHSQMDHSKMHQSKMDHAMPGHSGSTSTPKVTTPRKKKTSAHQHVGAPTTARKMNHGQMDHAQMDHGSAAPGMTTKGFLGPYPLTREGSGTSWVPDATPHEGFHQQLQDWSVMSHGWINLNYDRQAGPRGGDKTFVGGMLMTMAQRPLGDGTFGVRAMLSPEPFMGPSGYPLLLATGEPVCVWRPAGRAGAWSSGVHASH
jgi:hypothetical protein